MTAGRVLSKSGSLGVALVDTEMCGRVREYCLADEALRVVALFLGAVVATAVGAWVRVLRGLKRERWTLVSPRGRPMSRCVGSHEGDLSDCWSGESGRRGMRHRGYWRRDCLRVEGRRVTVIVAIREGHGRGV